MLPIRMRGLNKKEPFQSRRNMTQLASMQQGRSKDDALEPFSIQLLDLIQYM